MDNLSFSYDFLKNKRNEMNSYLYKHVDDAKKREKLLDQLRWLTYEIYHYKNNTNKTLIIDEFNWVIGNFNQELKLDQEEKIPYIKNLSCN